MIEGNFFKVDRDSLQEKGQVIFRYMPVKLKDETPKDETLKDKHHFYPVYAVLKPHAIDFYYHGPAPQSEAGQSNELHHVHVRILHLPLSLNLAVKDNLTSRLKGAFNAFYAIGDGYEFEINRKALFYSTLNCFSGAEGELDAPRSGSKIVMKKLILDFIYDLEHSRVFNASPHIETIEVRLKENFFFNAITAKAAYYFNRENYVQYNQDEEIRLLYAHNLADAEIDWLNVLRAPGSTEAFWHSRWFKHAEDEYRDVMFSEFKRYQWRREVSINDEDKDIDKQNIRILRETARWFLRRYALLSAVKTVLQYKEERKIWVYFAALLSFILLPMFMYKQFYGNGSIDAVALGVYVFSGLIPFIGFTGIFYRKMFLPLAGALLPRMIMATASSWLIVVTTEELWKSSFDVKLGENSWVFLLLIPVMMFMAIEIRNQAPDINSRRLFMRISYVLMAGWIYSLLIGLFFINFTGEKLLGRSGFLEEFYLDYTKEYRIEELGKNKIYALSVGCLDAGEERFAPYQDDMERLDAVRRKLGIFAENGDIDINSKPLLVKLAYLEDHYNDMEVESRDDFSWVRLVQEAPGDSLYHFLRYLRYNAFWSGTVRLEYEVPVFFWEDNYEDRLFTVFPGMLFFRSLFSLFVGIFIQLIFEDKPITEPL